MSRPILIRDTKDVRGPFCHIVYSDIEGDQLVIKYANVPMGYSLKKPESARDICGHSIISHPIGGVQMAGARIVGNTVIVRVWPKLTIYVLVSVYRAGRTILEVASSRTIDAGHSPCAIYGSRVFVLTAPTNESITTYTKLTGNVALFRAHLPLAINGRLTHQSSIADISGVVVQDKVWNWNKYAGDIYYTSGKLHTQHDVYYVGASNCHPQSEPDYVAVYPGGVYDFESDEEFDPEDKSTHEDKPHGQCAHINRDHVLTNISIYKYMKTKEINRVVITGLSTYPKVTIGATNAYEVCASHFIYVPEFGESFGIYHDDVAKCTHIIAYRGFNPLGDTVAAKFRPVNTWRKSPIWEISRISTLSDIGLICN